MTAVTVTRAQLKALFAARGFKTSDKWDDDKLIAKAAKIQEFVDGTLKDDDLATLEASILKASGKVELSKAEPANVVVPAEKTPPVKKAGKAGKEKPVKTGKKVVAKPAPKKVAKEKAPKKERGPGKIATIIDILQKASAKKPVTKAEVHAQLCKAFPEENADSMAKTVSVQIPYHLRLSKGLEVQKNDKGYWLPK